MSSAFLRNLTFTRMDHGRRKKLIHSGLQKLLPRTNLRWRAHGIAGLIQLIFGSILIISVLSGSYKLYKTPTVVVYYAATVLNSVYGWKLSYAKKGENSEWMPIFRQMASLQITLVYFIFRFNFPDLFAFLRMVDITLLAIYAVNYLHSLYQVLTTGNLILGIRIAFAVGYFALLLTLFYPVQFVAGGTPWWDCVQQQYPLQLLGFQAYVYVPCTYGFSVILFSVSLVFHKVISEYTLCVNFLVFGFLIPFMMVLHQEHHIPLVSTQKLYIPCPGKGVEWIDHSLDLSALSNKLLQVFGWNTY